MGCAGTFNPALKGKNAASEPFTVIGLDDPATMTIAPRGTPIYSTTYGNVAPRFGAAYRLNRREDRQTVGAWRRRSVLRLRLRPSRRNIRLLAVSNDFLLSFRPSPAYGGGDCSPRI